MNWSKKTLPPEHNAGEPLAQIVNGFAALMDQRVPPSGVGLFPQKQNSKDYSFSVYFSPACTDYCPEFLKHINAEKSEKPEASDVDLLLGNPDARSLLVA
jgi:hypothetical protein